MKKPLAVILSLILAVTLTTPVLADTTKTLHAKWAPKIDYPVTLKLTNNPSAITQVKTYHPNGNLANTYSNPGTSTTMTCYTGGKVVLYHNSSLEDYWYYWKINGETRVIDYGSACYFNVPSGISGSASLDIYSDTYSNDTYIDYYSSSGWVRSQDCYPMIVNEVLLADDYIQVANIIDFINTNKSTALLGSTSKQLCIQGDYGKYYVKIGRFEKGIDPDIISGSTQGILIYDAPSNTDSMLNNYKSAAHLGNIINYILYEINSIVGSETPLFTDTPETQEDSMVYTNKRDIIKHGIACVYGNESNFLCDTRGYTGYYYTFDIKSTYGAVNDNHRFAAAVWW